MFFEVVFVDLDVLEDFFTGSGWSFAFDGIGGVGIFFGMDLREPGGFGRELIIE